MVNNNIREFNFGIFYLTEGGVLMGDPHWE